ncbi:MAG: PASTA domain-containing protein [Actinobacteria bacterium]|nr:MAG: PASTA domain-containing protein [Actinomycetota bacterium]
MLQSYGFGVLVDTRPSGGPPGVVLSQDPAPGRRTLQGGLVRITVSFAAPTPPPSPKPSPTPTPTPTPTPSPSPSPSPSP